MNINNESINKTFFKFAIPSIVGLLIVSMQTMIDGIFVGNFVGPRGLAAINISMPYINILMSVGKMITAGYHGKDRSSPFFISIEQTDTR